MLLWPFGRKSGTEIISLWHSNLDRWESSPLPLSAPSERSSGFDWKIWNALSYSNLESSFWLVFIEFCIAKVTVALLESEGPFISLRIKAVVYDVLESVKIASACPVKKAEFKQHTGKELREYSYLFLVVMITQFLLLFISETVVTESINSHWIKQSEKQTFYIKLQWTHF